MADNSENAGKPPGWTNPTNDPDLEWGSSDEEGETQGGQAPSRPMLRVSSAPGPPRSPTGQSDDEGQDDVIDLVSDCDDGEKTGLGGRDDAAQGGSGIRDGLKRTREALPESPPKPSSTNKRLRPAVISATLAIGGEANTIDRKTNLMSARGGRAPGDELPADPHSSTSNAASGPASGSGTLAINGEGKPSRMKLTARNGTGGRAPRRPSHLGDELPADPHSSTSNAVSGPASGSGTLAIDGQGEPIKRKSKSRNGTGGRPPLGWKPPPEDLPADPNSSMSNADSQGSSESTPNELFMRQILHALDALRALVASALTQLENERKDRDNGRQGGGNGKGKGRQT